MRLFDDLRAPSFCVCAACRLARFSVLVARGWLLRAFTGVYAGNGRGLRVRILIYVWKAKNIFIRNEGYIFGC